MSAKLSRRKVVPKTAFKTGPDSRRNLKGRPPIPHTFSEMLREKIPHEEVLKVFKKRLIEGDARIIEMWLNRIEGKVPDTVVQINTMFKEGDLLADKTILWLTKFHPKLVMEWRKAVGLL
jgi:hypothetical protein